LVLRYDKEGGDTMKQFVCEVATLKQKGKVRVFVNNKPVLVVWIDDQPYAVHDKCPHESYPLSTGRIRNGVIECKEHGLEIDLKTGLVHDEAKADYLKMSEYDRSIKTYQTGIEDNKVYVEL